MITPKPWPRAALSLALTLALACLLPLNRLAAANAVEKEKRAPPAVRADTALTVSAGLLEGKGQITVNGIPAQPGATVLSGSTIATGADGLAALDLAGSGRVELRPRTTAELVLSPGSVEVTLGAGAITQSVPAGVTGQAKFRGDRVHLAVLRGELVTTTPSGAQVIRAGESLTINAPVAVSSRGETLFTAEATGAATPAPAPQTTGEEQNRIVMFTILGIAIGGVITGIAIEASDDDNDGVGTVSPIR
jgi:hypothetical protein